MLKSLRRNSLNIIAGILIAALIFGVIFMIASIVSTSTTRNEKLDMVKSFISDELSLSNIEFDDIELWYTENEDLYDHSCLIKLSNNGKIKNLKVSDGTIKELFTAIDNINYDCYTISEKINELKSSGSGLAITWL